MQEQTHQPTTEGVKRARRTLEDFFNEFQPRKEPTLLDTVKHTAAAVITAAPVVIACGWAIAKIAKKVARPL